MEYIVWIFLALGLAMTGIYIFVRIKNGGVLALLLKAASSLFFVITAGLGLIANNGCHHEFGIFVILGLVCGLCGDIMLDARTCHPENGHLYTVAGVLSFSYGHIFYITALFLNFYTANIAVIIVPIAVAFAISVFVLFGEKMLKINMGKLRPFTFIYGYLLFWMAGLSVALAIINFSATTVIFGIAGLLFALSDLFLLKMFWGEQGKNSSPLFISLNLSSYYIAQFLIALTILLF
jgi:hypothetical protein